MAKITFSFSEIVDYVYKKPEDMENYARQQMEGIRQLLKSMPAYTCPSECNNCCHGSILMSYVEYINIITAIRQQSGTEELARLFDSRLGVLEEEGKLLCPFVSDDKEKEHCTIYHERPLICRIFGTSASPCDEEIDFPGFSEALFYRAYNSLYYMEDGSFIGLPLTDVLALYKAPFDIWAIADSGHTDALMSLFEEHGSMRAVIFDVPANRYCTILPGGNRQYLDEA